MNNWFIIAQILGVITIGFEFASYQIKDKSKYFLVTGIGSFFWMAMFIAMGLATSMDTQRTLVIAGVYSTFRNLVFWQIFSRNTPQSKELGLNFLLVMIAVAITVNIINIPTVPEQVRWLHILGAFAAMGFVVGQYLPGVHYVRITVVIYAFMVILSQTPINILQGDFRWNIMGIAIELAKVISVVIFYIRYSNEPAKPQLQFAKP